MFALSWAGDKGCACQIERWVSSQGFRASPAPGGEAAKDTKIPNNYFLILDFWILKAFSVFLAQEWWWLGRGAVSWCFAAWAEREERFL